MFHMLSCFNLKPGITIDEFRQSIGDFRAHLEDMDLVQSIGPIGRRQSESILDTDGERDHQFFFITSFRDRAQCDRAIEHMYSHGTPGDSVHKGVYAKIKDEIFVCWEDLS